MHLLSVAIVALVAAPTAAQDKNQRKLEDSQRADAQALVTLVDEAALGKPVTSSFTPAWQQQHFIKAQGDKTYVPFTVSLEPGSLSAPSLGVYLRVARKGQAPTPPAEAQKQKDQKDQKDGAAERETYPFEDLHFVDLPAPGAQGEAQPYTIRRAFAVPPGEYDVYVAVKERGAAQAPAGSGQSAAPKVGFLKHSLTVPDLGGTDLTTSSVIVADKVDVLQAPPPPDRQAENPYTFGPMRVVPSLDNSFSKKEELSLIFWIYNAAVDEAKKPDLVIDYKFHQKTGDKETYFNKTEPQALNAQTLPPNFDAAAGHQLPGSLAVPLASFPEGDYRLEIEVTDKLANKKVTRDVNFSVAGQ